MVECYWQATTEELGENPHPSATSSTTTDILTSGRESGNSTRPSEARHDELPKFKCMEVFSHCPHVHNANTVLYFIYHHSICAHRFTRVTFQSGFLTKFLWISCFLARATCPAHIIFLDLMVQIIFVGRAQTEGVWEHGSEKNIWT
jgi:hypothetical protein